MKNPIRIPISRWAYFWSYLFATLLIPAAGFGFFLFWRVEKKRVSRALIADEDRLRIPDPDEPGGGRLLDLLVIQKIEIQNAAVPGRWFGVQTLIFQTGSGEIYVPGIQNASRLKETILTAAKILSEKRQKTAKKEVQSKTIPGSTDQLNELTLMWQQGLIDDQQFDRERKKFS